MITQTSNSVKSTHDFALKLKAYSAAAIAFTLFSNPVSAQVVYTDIEPDVVLDTDGNYYAVDIDNNGTPDFQFLKSSFSTYDFTLGYIYYNDLWAGLLNSLNSIAGISHYYPYPGVLKVFPYALSMNDKIDSKLTWQKSTDQLIAVVENVVGYDVHCFNCSWNGNSLQNVIDHYLGVSFIDQENKKHYGWIRCDVINDGLKLILKDYAYEIQPAYAILAGSTSTYQEISPGNIQGEIYAADNTIYISITKRPTEKFYIKVYNLAAEIIYAGQSENPFVEITLDIPYGIYVVEIISGDERLSKKINLR